MTLRKIEVLTAALTLCACSTAPPPTPSPEYLAARRDCGEQGLRAMHSGASDDVSGEVISQCLTARGFPVR